MPRRLRVIDLGVIVAVGFVLVAVLLPQRFGGDRSRFVSHANLIWQYQTLQTYEQARKKPPPGTGHEFILAPWIDGTVQHTPENLARYFQPSTHNPRFAELAARDLATLWRSPAETTSADTDYAGPGPGLAGDPGLLRNGKLPVMAEDDELGPAYPDHRINLLMGDGSVCEIEIERLRELGFDENVPNACFPVGPDSPHPLLARLAR
ncbi:MAG: hypothetical protein HZB39_03060 [Planctomycetes bacterium]|nr:hypothetical protein [Planctomycetota bacterium]